MMVQALKVMNFLIYLKDSTKEKKETLDLDLSISKNVIEKLNGKISASNSESGALFIIELPIYINSN